MRFGSEWDIDNEDSDALRPKLAEPILVPLRLDPLPRLLRERAERWAAMCARLRGIIA